MLESVVQQKIRELVEMTRENGRGPMNLRVAWATLGGVLGYERWTDEVRQELSEINADFERYIGTTQLAKAGHEPASDVEFKALIDRIRGLERLLPGPRPGVVRP